MTLWRELSKIHGDIKERFFYLSDEAKYGKYNYWASPSESIDTNGDISGDCEDFAIVAQQRCKEAGITNSRLVLCRTKYGGVHVVLEVEGFILDNRRDSVVAREYLDYKWVKLQDYDGKWRAIE